ncbi:hypothetical protein F5880DRAFT_1478758 [Lentinula raphanica]|nr:hypothetical protein F5880DRAFT_1478758 [Lentinula raphanica]
MDQFIRFARHLKPELSLALPDITIPPELLPSHVASFLANALNLDKITIDNLWSILRHHIWQLNEVYINPTERILFDEHGSRTARKEHKIAYFMFYPPYTRCPCCNHLLNRISRVTVTFFTKDGPFPAYSTSLRCNKESCETRYYLNYCVKIKTHIRQYYDEPVPEVIHLEDHSFIQVALSELFTSCTLFAWVSSQNCASIYNHTLSSYSHKEVHESKFTLTSTQVWRSFVLVSLLKDWRDRGQTLIMREDAELNLRLQELMCQRNERIIVEGQRERLHACNTCSLRAVVTDGVTLGHPCCKVHNCSEPLQNNRHHWCKTHIDRQRVCVFADCNLPAHFGHRTCGQSSHQKYEDYRNLKGKGFFLLRQRLQRAGVQQPLASLDSDLSIPEDDLVDITEADDPNTATDPSHKSDKGNRPSRALFARRRTHNEQLVVCTCGIIAARATMYGAEAISGVKDFLKSVYPIPNDLPDVIFYDNNCHLQAHLQAQNDTFFRGTMLPVDVFHFKSKHKESDEFCQRHCNPSQWTELVGDNGEWVFNSSAAEQANVWIGGYQAIVREMLYYNYNFFLDKMIRRRNEVLITKLRKASQVPYHIPPYPATL